jgi:hypothetical protein
MGELIEMPGQAASKREEAYDGLAFLLRILAVVLLLSAVPLNIWLWTVAL